MYLLNSVGYMHSFTILQTTPHTAMYMLLITQLQKINNRNIIFMSIAGPGFSFCVCGTYPSVNVSQQSAYSLGDISKTWLHYCQECLLVNLKYCV